MRQRDTGKIVILTGAGISKESGLDTFRDSDGIWSRVRIEDVATPEAFARDPVGVHAFYNARRARLRAGGIQPNAAHRALARLQAVWPDDVLIVTQNIDDLHERAGTTALIHMHGKILEARCQACHAVNVWLGDMTVESVCPGCALTGNMRVNVVWFGEMPFQMERISDALEACSLFVAIGTSGSVYPAAGFVQEVRAIGRGHTVELNLVPSEGHGLFAEACHGPATEMVPDFVDRILREGW